MAETPSISVGAALPGEQFAAAAAALFKAGDDIFNILNSPTMLALRQTADIQDALNKMDADLAAAKKTGDLTTINQEASG
jgi:hypothetical protein